MPELVSYCCKSPIVWKPNHAGYLTEFCKACDKKCDPIDSETKSLNLEICICAAIKGKDGRVMRGQRHSDCLVAARARQWDLDGHVQGFMTSMNNFVTREEGRTLQNAAGIASASPEGYMGTTLFSEDLY